MKSNTLYAGVDLHKKFSYITIVNGEGEKIKQQKVAHKDEAQLQHFFDQYEQPMEIGVEATFNSHWFWNLIESQEQQRTVHIGNARQIKAIGSGAAKTDKIDSGILANLVRANMFPTAHTSTLTDRKRKEIVRLRYFFVRHQTAVKNKIHSYLLRENVHHDFTDLFGKKGLEWLEREVQLDSIYQPSLKRCLQEYKYLKGQIGQITKILQKENKDIPEIKLLQTIPGIGIYIATLLIGEIGDIRRFPNAKKLCSYFGLVPEVRQSGEKKYYGSITKDGSKYGRWGLAEAIQRLGKHDSQLGKQYRKVLKKRGKKIAAIVMARKLTTVIYHCLTTGEVFRPYPENATGHSSR